MTFTSVHIIIPRMRRQESSLTSTLPVTDPSTVIQLLGSGQSHIAMQRHSMSGTFDTAPDLSLRHQCRWWDELCGTQNWHAVCTYTIYKRARLCASMCDSVLTSYSFYQSYQAECESTGPHLKRVHEWCGY